MSQWKVYSEHDLYFVTTTIVDWQYVFTSNSRFQIIVEALRYCIRHKGLQLHAYVIMPNHAHYILSTNANVSLSDVMRDMQRYTARQLISALINERSYSLLAVFRNAAKLDQLGNSFKVWQDGFHPVTIGSKRFARQKLLYLHDNPVRKGFVEHPEDWKYSSARNYRNDDYSLLPVDFIF